MLVGQFLNICVRIHIIRFRVNVGFCGISASPTDDFGIDIHVESFFIAKNAFFHCYR